MLSANMSSANVEQPNNDLPKSMNQSARNITLTGKGYAFQFELADKARTRAHRDFQFQMQTMEQIDLENCDPQFLGLQFDDLKTTFHSLRKKQRHYESLLNENC